MYVAMDIFGFESGSLFILTLMPQDLSSQNVSCNFGILMSDHETLFLYEPYGRLAVEKGKASRRTPQIPPNGSQAVEAPAHCLVVLAHL